MLVNCTVQKPIACDGLRTLPRILHFTGRTAGSSSHVQPAAPKGASRPTIVRPCIRNTTVLIIDWRMRTTDNTRSQLQLSRCRGAGALAYLHSAKIAMCFLIQLTRRSALLCNSCGAQRFFCTVHFCSRHSPHMIPQLLFLIQTGVFALCILHGAGANEG